MALGPDSALSSSRVKHAGRDAFLAKPEPDLKRRADVDHPSRVPIALRNRRLAVQIPPLLPGPPPPPPRRTSCLDMCPKLRVLRNETKQARLTSVLLAPDPFCVRRNSYLLRAQAPAVLYPPPHVEFNVNLRCQMSESCDDSSVLVEYKGWAAGSSYSPTPRCLRAHLSRIPWLRSHLSCISSRQLHPAAKLPLKEAMLPSE
ncbi:hypothetical protein C8F04DRAFT_527918 [Mycena alexandri]|uniref:Uncharacterized protein n=1 Tax=Mycena alexandri TaxID=1745969 RepID=A0AAD6TFL2_9AGAR|nr:hypothetical protein C8F04DRAFT_527918 [Mycena alexandri]